MKNIYAAIVLSLSIMHGFSADYTAVDKRSKSTPQELHTVEELSAHLTKGLTKDSEKARAFYVWIAHNIRYDLASLNAIRNSSNTKTAENYVSEAISLRKGVCAHYAELFHALCKTAKLTSYVVVGYTVEKGGSVPNIAHAWNALLIEGQYHLIDATWAAGYTQNDKYVHSFTDQFFMIAPASFIHTHVPFDPIWQFADNPLTNKDIQKGNWAKLEKRGNFNFRDSIASMEGLPKLEKYLRIKQRISSTGLTNDLIRENVAYYQLLIGNEKLTQAIDNYNQGVGKYNSYVMNKNKQFKGSEGFLQENKNLLLTAREEIESAEKMIQFLNLDDASLTLSLQNLQVAITDLKKNLDAEDIFMQKYLKQPKPFRIFSFLKFRGKD